MGHNWQSDVRAFHEKCGQEVNNSPSLISEDTISLRYSLIDEEVNKELLPILKKLQEKGTWDSEDFIEDLAATADGIVDAIYVLLGAAVSLGITIQPIWDATQEANMQKFTGPKRGDGKILKPEGWKHPDVKALIEHQLNHPEKYRELDLTNPEDNAIYIREIEEAHEKAEKSTLRFSGGGLGKDIR
jgi:predicted HAD superfamily Cof-like phosphohydrolase